MKISFIAGAVCLAGTLLTCSARADTIYTYTGQPFTFCSVTGAGFQDYYPCGSITAVVDLVNPLPANLQFSPHFVSYMLGNPDLDPSDFISGSITSPYFSQDLAYNDVDFATDANGELINWFVYASLVDYAPTGLVDGAIDVLNTPASQYYGTNADIEDAMDFNSYYDQTELVTDNFQNYNDLGTWTCSGDGCATGPAPEPGTYSLMLIGLGLLVMGKHIVPTFR